MPRLPFFLRRPPGPTVPSNWVEVFNQYSPTQNIFLPTSGSASYEHTFNLGFTMRVGYIYILSCLLTAGGVTYTGAWNGWVRVKDVPANVGAASPPVGYDNQMPLSFTGVTTEQVIFGTYVYNVFTRTSLTPSITFMVMSTSGSPPYRASFNFNLRVLRPTVFTPFFP
jgi:hypothetical protein